VEKKAKYAKIRGMGLESVSHRGFGPAKLKRRIRDEWESHGVLNFSMMDCV
jgi:hypothetical protein